jgi:hypothetical protein
MLNLIATIFIVELKICFWGSLVLAIYVVINIALKIKKGKQTAKMIFKLILCSLYIIVFISLEISLGEIFQEIAQGFLFALAFASSQFSKYEDRKAGRRGWYS